jgi:hypothetical protein
MLAQSTRKIIRLTRIGFAAFLQHVAHKRPLGGLALDPFGRHGSLARERERAALDVLGRPVY